MFPVNRVEDPVCGMRFHVTDKTLFSVREGRRFYFCCARCKSDFEADPRKYSGGRGRVNRWLEKVARANERQFKGKPSCH